MTTAYTALLGLAQPVPGELTGTWGTVVNDSITALLDTAIAGTKTADVTSSNWTLTDIDGADDTARAAVLIPTGTNGATTRSILAPNQSKIYVIINQATGSVVIKGVTGPTTGVTITAGSQAVVAWNGSDFVNLTPVGVTPGGALGTPSSGTLTNCTADGTNAVGYKNIPQTGSDKTTAYQLALTDVGKYVGVGSGGSIVIPVSIFSNGDAISVFNNTTGNITFDASAVGLTAYIGGDNTDRSSITLATRGISTILFISGSICVVSGNVS